MILLEKKNLRRIKCVVTAQTLYHLKKIQEQYEYKNIGKAIDEVVKLNQLSQTHK